MAEALQISNQTVWRMIRNGELEAKGDTYAYEIPVESLRKWIFRALGMYGAERVCKQAERNQEISLKNTQHLAGHRRLYLSQNLKKVPSNALEPRVALEQLESLLRSLAVRYGGKQAWLRDDLYQEMALAILSCEGANTPAYYAELAEWRAIDFVRRELDRGIVYADRLRLDECTRSVRAADCSKVAALFKLARLPLSLLELFGVHLIEEQREEDQRVA